MKPILTDEEIKRVVCRNELGYCDVSQYHIDLSRAIEDALLSKLAQQEPVLRVGRLYGNAGSAIGFYKETQYLFNFEEHVGKRFYAAPPPAPDLQASITNLIEKKILQYKEFLKYSSMGEASCLQTSIQELNTLIKEVKELP